MGWYLSGGGLPHEEPAQALQPPPVVIEKELSYQERAYDRCGKYKLLYTEEANGFYNCRKNT